MTYQAHEYANLFPMMTDREFSELVESMKRDGYHEYSPIVIYQGMILDGRNRYRAADTVGVLPMLTQFVGDDEAAYQFAKSNNLARKHWDPDQLAVIALDIEAVEAERAKARMLAGIKANPTADQQQGKGMAAEKAAKQVGASTRKVQRAKALRKSSPELAEEVKEGKKTLKQAEDEVKAQVKQEKRAELMAQADKHEAKEYDGFKVNDVYLADIHRLELPPNSVDMIFTDPPYHDEHLGLFLALARFAHRALKPGGYLMTYSGKMFLPQVMNSLGECLEYVWMYGIFQPDSNHKIQKHHIFQTWRPIVCFKKPGKTMNVDWQPDMIKGTRDKSFHEWQQQIEAPLKWIDAYTLPGDLVVDPFVGGGTTLAACKQLKRNYMGFDVDPDAVKLSKLRLEQL